MKVVAISDASGGVYNKNGINIPKAMQWIGKNRVLKGMAETEPMTNEDLLELPVDVLVPAAIDGVITEKNAARVKAKIIAEGANGPLTTDAIKDIESRGIFLIPDILCNAGGVIVSYFEWVQGLQHLFWTETEVNSKLAQVMENAFVRVIEVKERLQCGMKTAALVAGVDRLNRAMLMRGLFP